MVRVRKWWMRVKSTRVGSKNLFYRVTNLVPDTAGYVCSSAKELKHVEWHLLVNVPILGSVNRQKLYFYWAMVRSTVLWITYRSCQEWIFIGSPCSYASPVSSVSYARMATTTFTCLRAQSWILLTSLMTILFTASKLRLPHWDWIINGFKNPPVKSLCS